MKLKLLKTIAPIAGVATIAALPLSSCGEPATYTADIKAIEQHQYERITEYKEPDSIDADEALSIYMQDVRANPAIIFDDACEYYAITNTWSQDVKVSGTVGITVTRARGARLSFIADVNLQFLHPEGYQEKEEVRGRLEAHNIKLAMYHITGATNDDKLSSWFITSAYLNEKSEYDPELLQEDTKWSYTLDGVLSKWVGEEKVDYEISSKFSYESDIEELDPQSPLGGLISHFVFAAQYFKDIQAQRK